MVFTYRLSYYISRWWNKIEADKSGLPSCQVWRGCQMCADVLAARGLRLGGVEGQLWGSPGSYPSGLLARCGAGLHRRQRSEAFSVLWTEYDNKKAFFDMTFWQHTNSVSCATGTTLPCQDITAYKDLLWLTWVLPPEITDTSVEQVSPHSAELIQQVAAGDVIGIPEGLRLQVLETTKMRWGNVVWMKKKRQEKTVSPMDNWGPVCMLCMLARFFFFFFAHQTLRLWFGIFSFTWQTGNIWKQAPGCHLWMTQTSFWRDKLAEWSAWECGDVMACFAHAQTRTMNNTGRLPMCVCAYIY